MGRNELYHWGIFGMKWGRRRYRNLDGTLTPAGKERYYKQLSKQIERNSEIRGQTIHSVDPTKLDDETLKKYTDRLELENKWETAVANWDKAHPKKQNAVKAYIKEFSAKYSKRAIEGIADIGVDVGKNYLKEILSEAFGVEEQNKKKKK